MFTRIFGYSIKNIFRNKFLSISSVLVITLLVFFINLLLVIQNISFKLIDTVNDKLTISLYLEDEYNKNSEPVRLLINNIEDLNQWIEVFYKTKADVLEEIRKKDPELVSILEKNNPLPETIQLSKIPMNSWDDINWIIESKIFLFSKEHLESREEVNQHFSEYRTQYENIQQVNRPLMTLTSALYIMIVLFLFSIWIIIYSIIWNFVFHYKNEIYITKLVWWSNIFIYWPFILQWIIYSIMSFILWIALFKILVIISNIKLNSNYNFAYLLWNYELLFLVQILILILIWGLSGLISSKKYLK